MTIEVDRDMISDIIMYLNRIRQANGWYNEHNMGDISTNLDNINNIDIIITKLNDILSKLEG
jgi:hypothetical protein